MEGLKKVRASFLLFLDKYITIKHLDFSNKVLYYKYSKRIKMNNI